MLISVDYETCLIQPAELAPPAVCLAWTDGHRGELLHAKFDREAIHARWDAWLAGADVLVGHNIAYDLGVLVADEPRFLEPVFDKLERDEIMCVYVAERLLDIAEGYLSREKGYYALEGMTRRHLGVALDKDTWRLGYGKLRDTPCSMWPAGAREYPMGDVHYALLHAQRQQARRWKQLAVGVWHDDLADVFRQTRASWWLQLMMCWGFTTDPQWVGHLRAHVGKEIDALGTRLRQAGLMRLDGKRDLNAVRARLKEVCRARGVEPKMTPGGAKKGPEIATDDEACKDSGDPLLKDFARFSSLNTIWTKDLPALAAPVIQSRFETIVETGRTGSSGAAKDGGATDGFQLQNVRREPGVREAFVPRPGCALLSVDYGQMELHAWAQVCIAIVGWSKLAEALNAKIDVHCLLGGQVIGVDYDTVYAGRKDKYKKVRQDAKPGNFGFPGGLGWRGFMAFAKNNYGVVLSHDEARAIQRGWKDLWPEHAPYFAHIRRLVGEEFGSIGEIIQLGSDRRRGGVFYTDACNSPFQGLAADTAKQAGFYLARACYVRSTPSLVYGRSAGNPLYGCRTVNFIHDEFLLEVPLAVLHEAALETVAVMEEAGRRWMPDCPPRAEPAAMMRWRKEAEPRYEGGRLVPWRPKKKGAEGVFAWDAEAV